MAVSSLAHLPEPVLAQLLGGMLLTYFRSAHTEHADLYLLREHELPIDPPYTVRVDWAIYDKVRRRVVAAFDLVRTPTQFRNRRETLQRLREHASRQLPPQMSVGLVAPESVVSEFRPWATKHKVEVVTYPA